MKFYKIYPFLFLLFIASCQTTQEKLTPEAEKKEEPSIVKDDFFSKTPAEDEAIYIFVSSDNYTLKQVGFEKTMSLEGETQEKKAMSEEIGNYDMVELFTEAIYKIELYKDSGLISHIRPVKPSKVSEINKIIADDITRLKFKFQDPKNIDPQSFKIRYGIQLRKKKSREEIKKILQDNVIQ